MAKKPIPIDVVDLLPKLDALLIDLLHNLKPEDWKKQTVAKLWQVKDVVAHLLDGNIRVLSMLRDNHRAETPTINSYSELVTFLNNLNADWVKAMNRVSPEMLIVLHKLTGPMYSSYYKSLDPFLEAEFAVSWAGESVSLNWMHIAREYTEKFLHQQQIREATGHQGIMTKEYFYPFISILMRGLPHTLRDTPAVEGAVVQITITGSIGGTWRVVKKTGIWQHDESISSPDAEVLVDPDIAWKLFSKSLRPADVKDRLEVRGDQRLGTAALSMVSVMA